MMKRLIQCLCVLWVAATLLGVSALAEEAAVTHLDATDMKHSRVEQVLEELAKYPNLQSVTFNTTAMKMDVLRTLREAYPGLEMEYTVNICGKRVRSTVETLNLYKDHKFKTFEQFLEELAALPRLKHLSALRMVLTSEQLDILAERFPQLEVDCRVSLGGPTVQTHVTAFSTQHGYGSKRYTSYDFRGLKHCRNLLALDIGHNAVESVAFLADLPQLRILILADNQITDLSPLAQLKDLEYLELFKNPIEDVSPLAELPKLFDLNITFCNISDATPLLKLTGLKRLYLTENPLSDEQKQMLLDHFPDCDINFDANDAPTAGGWRQGHPRYLDIVDIFKRSRYKEFTVK